MMRMARIAACVALVFWAVGYVVAVSATSRALQLVEEDGGAEEFFGTLAPKCHPSEMDQLYAAVREWQRISSQWARATIRLAHAVSSSDGPRQLRQLAAGSCPSRKACRIMKRAREFAQDVLQEKGASLSGFDSKKALRVMRRARGHALDVLSEKHVLFAELRKFAEHSYVRLSPMVNHVINDPLLFLGLLRERASVAFAEYSTLRSEMRTLANRSYAGTLTMLDSVNKFSALALGDARGHSKQVIRDFRAFVVPVLRNSVAVSNEQARLGLRAAELALGKGHAAVRRVAATWKAEHIRRAFSLARFTLRSARKIVHLVSRLPGVAKGLTIVVLKGAATGGASLQQFFVTAESVVTHILIYARIVLLIAVVGCVAWFWFQFYTIFSCLMKISCGTFDFLRNIGYGFLVAFELLSKVVGTRSSHSRCESCFKTPDPEEPRASEGELHAHHQSPDPQRSAFNQDSRMGGARLSQSRSESCFKFPDPAEPRVSEGVLHVHHLSADSKRSIFNQDWNRTGNQRDIVEPVERTSEDSEGQSSHRCAPGYTQASQVRRGFTEDSEGQGAPRWVPSSQPSQAEFYETRRQAIGRHDERVPWRPLARREAKGSLRTPLHRRGPRTAQIKVRYANEHIPQLSSTRATVMPRRKSALPAPRRRLSRPLRSRENEPCVVILDDSD